MNQRSILIIEEDRGIQEVAKFCLEMDGHWQVSVVNCGAEGFSIAKTIIPDVILLDSVALNQNKVEILERLQSDRATQSIPIILFTTKLLDLKRLKCQNSSLIGTINKPFDSLTLSKNILEILQKKKIGRSPKSFLFARQICNPFGINSPIEFWQKVMPSKNRLCREYNCDRLLFFCRSFLAGFLPQKLMFDIFLDSSLNFFY